MGRSLQRWAMYTAAMLFAAHSARADLTLLGQFPSAGAATPVSCGFDPTTDSVWVYEAFEDNIIRYSRTGSPLGSVARPGEQAVVADVTFSSSGLTLGATPVAAGSLLFVNGETGVADIYAVNKSTGAVTATLATAFGVSQVVGGSYHRGRGTFFLLQSFQAAGTVNDNLVAEIQLSTGLVLGTFATTTAAPGYTVDFGDVEVGANGDLFVVSSNQQTILELTPTGAFVRQLLLPPGVNSISGLGLDLQRGEGWVVGTNGTVWQLGGFPTPPLTLVESKGTAGAAVLSWALIPGATTYDVVRGDLGPLRQGQGYAAATTACVSNNAAGPPVTDSTALALGGARWYLLRADVGTYNDGSNQQVANRDPGIASSGHACP